MVSVVLTRGAPVGSHEVSAHPARWTLAGRWPPAVAPPPGAQEEGRVNNGCCTNRGIKAGWGGDSSLVNIY